MTDSLRIVAIQMLDHAAQVRDLAQRRCWQARDEATRLRLLHLEAKATEAVAVRELEQAQAIVDMVWNDLRPALATSREDATERDSR